MPRCSGVTHVNAGDSTSLVCESTYSGNEQPQLDWYRQGHRRHRLTDSDDLPRAADTRHGQRVDSSDEFDIRETGPVARQVCSPDPQHVDKQQRQLLQANRASCLITMQHLFVSRK